MVRMWRCCHVQDIWPNRLKHVPQIVKDSRDSKSRCGLPRQVDLLITHTDKFRGFDPEDLLQMSVGNLPTSHQGDLDHNNLTWGAPLQDDNLYYRTHCHGPRTNKALDRSIDGRTRESGNTGDTGNTSLSQLLCIDGSDKVLLPLIQVRKQQAVFLLEFFCCAHTNSITRYTSFLTIINVRALGQRQIQRGIASNIR